MEKISKRIIGTIIGGFLPVITLWILFFSSPSSYKGLAILPTIILSIIFFIIGAFFGNIIGKSI